MVAQPSLTPPAEPSWPDWFRRFVLRLTEFFVSTNPVRPVKLPAYATPDLPDPAMFTNCIAIDSTTGSLVYSNGSAWV